MIYYTYLIINFVISFLDYVKMCSISDIFASSSSSSSRNSSLNLLEDISSSEKADLAKMAKAKEEEDDKRKELENLSLKKENAELKNKIKKMEEIQARYEKTLEIFEKEKNGLEDKLYSKFLPVLNAKKEEILRLQKLLSISRGTDKAEVDYGEDVDTDVDEEEEGDEACDSKRQKL